MTEELHNNNDLPISSGMGWMQMEALLNKNLPVKKRITKTRLVLSCLPVTILCSIFLFSSLQLDRHLFFTALKDNPKVAFQDQAKIDPFFLINDNNNEVASNHAGVVEKRYSDLIFNEEHDLPIPVKNQFIADASTPLMQRISNQNFLKIIPQKKNKNSVPVIPPAKFNKYENSTATLIQVNKYSRKMPWEISAGIGMNIAEGKKQNLQPYPVAEVKYNLSSRFFVAAGLSFFAPKPGSVSGISKTVYVNDTVNNISLYNEMVSYDHLRYADIPVSVGVNIGEKITFQTGVQLSVLVSKQQKKSLQPYDFQMNNIDLPFTAPLIGLAAVPQQEFDVRVSNIDYRLISGIKYKTNRITAGLFYQHTLSSAALGNNKSTTNKGLLTFNLMYQIK